MTLKKYQFNQQSHFRVTLFVFKYIWPLLYVLFIFKSLTAQAQLDNYWTWNFHSLDFNSQTPKPGLSSGAMGSTICDSSGKLLFYCDGNIVYDRKNDTMPYFKSTYPMEYYNVIIIPKNNFEYYIFGINNLTSQFHLLLYNVVDIRLNNGFGDVEKSRPDTLYKGVFYTLSATYKHGGGFWLFTKNLDSIYAFPVDSNGIGKPAKSYMYEKLSNEKTLDPVRSYGQYAIRPSHDGRMVVTTCSIETPSPVYYSFSTVYAYDFNNTTGQFSNQRLLTSDSVAPGIQYFGEFYGCAFSANDSLLYIAHDPPAPTFKTPYPDDIVYQFQRYATDIKASLFKIYLGDSSIGDSISSIADIKEGPNGKIYLAFFKIGQNSSLNNLGILNYPDRVGKACNLNLSGPLYLCDNSAMGSESYSGGFPLTISGYSPLSYVHSGQCGLLNFNAKSDSLFTKYTWYMQDINGNTIDSVTGANIKYSFKKSGKYIVTLQGMSKAGYKKWYSDTILYNTKPIAHFSVSQGSFCQYNHIVFTSQNQTDTSGESWHWDFGDLASSVDSSAQPAPEHIYSSTGTYTVKLSNTIGVCTADTTMVLNILPAPKPGFRVSDSVGCQPLIVKLTSNATGTITKTYYDFGNGTNASVSSPTVVYSSAGSYKILQEVTGPNGCVTKDSANITVNPTPDVKFQGTDSVCVGTEIQFGFPPIAGYIYSWTSLPRGFISDLSKPIDIPKLTTTYDLKETISATGCTDSGKAVYCFVEQRPIAAFAYKYLRGFDYQFSVKRSKNVSYSFDFGDSQHISLIKNDSSISHTFPGNGTYIVTLTAVSDTDLKCESTITDTIIINEPFSLNIFPNPFSLQTDINYLLLKPGHVKISLTDEIGRQIGTLVDKQLAPGEYDTEFNAPLWETRPGMYFVLFQLDDTLIVKKIIQMESIFY